VSASKKKVNVAFPTHLPGCCSILTQWYR